MIVLMANRECDDDWDNDQDYELMTGLRFGVKPSVRVWE
jgi:hypothetical protein